MAGYGYEVRDQALGPSGLGDRSFGDKEKGVNRSRRRGGGMWRDILLRKEEKGRRGKGSEGIRME